MTKQVLDRASGDSVEEADFASPVEHDLLSTEVYVRLRRQIVRGHFAPGQRIGEADFARRWRVSQATVREALRRLASDGLLIQIPRRGSYVASVSEATARLAYDVRFAVEPVAVTQALARRDSTLLAALEYELDRMRAAAAADDTAMLVDADVTFHRRVWEQSEGDLLPRIWTQIEAAIRGFTLITNRVYFGNLRDIAETHAPLVEMLRTGSDASIEAFTEHVRAVWAKFDASSRTPGV